MPPPIRRPRTRSWSSGRSAPPGRPCSGRVAARHATAGSRTRTRAPPRRETRETREAREIAYPPRSPPFPPPSPAQELADDRRLPGFLQQEAVVAVRGLDQLELY